METPYETAAPEGEKKKRCDIFEGNTDAKGYAVLAAGRGAIVMANIVLSQSFLHLATEAAGCEAGTECNKRIYGQFPASWISNIAVFTGLVGAFMLPITGALVDYTDYRREVGAGLSAFMTIIQAIQIYTVESTWFPMLILQGVATVSYVLFLVPTYAYLPEIQREVGEYKMAGFTSSFIMVQFGAQALYLVLMAVVTFLIPENATVVIVLAQISQGICTFTSIVFFGIGWFKFLGKRKAVRELPKGRSLLLEGFRSNFQTLKKIQKHFKKGMRWFFLAVTFSQAAAAAITSLAVIFLSGSIGLGVLGVNVFFVDVLVFSLLGSPIGAAIARKTNPNTSYMLSLVYSFIAVAIGMLTLQGAPQYCTFIWGAFVGVGLGWLYGSEALYLSMILPVGQESEMSGFYNFATQILGALPPLIFTVVKEAGVEARYAFLAATAFFLPAVGFLMCTGKWEEILEETKTGVVENAVATKDDEEEILA